MQSRIVLSIAIAGTALAGCAAGPAPANLATAQWATGQSAASQGHPQGHPQGEWLGMAAEAPSACESYSVERPAGQEVTLGELGSADHLLAAGDRVHVDVLGDPDGLSGTYTVDANGTVALGSVAPVRAEAMRPAEFEQALRSALVSEGLVRPLRSAVRVRLAEAAGVSVAVSGAVFQSGQVRPGERSPESRIGQKEGEVSGDANPSCSVSAAIRAAGGVRPDADIGSVFLIRGNRFAAIDMTGLIDGERVIDPVVTSGDRIVVPATACFRENLVRPSQLTQPGIKVHMSNLTRSANNNAGAAIGEKTGSLPYGTRLLQGLVAMNCVGGSHMQAGRRAILISRNPRNGQSIVIERDVEKLVRQANRDDADPYLMPGDALACYDSRWTNFREALGLVGEVAGSVTPALLLQQAID